MGTSNMIKEVENSFGQYSPFRKRYTDILLENCLNSGRMCENGFRCLECKDSVDDFINKHTIFIDKDVKQNSKSSNSTQNHHFDNELLVSTILKNNIKLNNLLYTLVDEIGREKQNKKSKRFIKLLKKEYDKDADRNVSYQNECKSVYSKLSRSSSNSQITWKLLNVLNNFYNERERGNLQLYHNSLSKQLRKHSSKTNKSHYLHPGHISSCDDISMLRRERCVANPNRSSTFKRTTILKREQRSLPTSIHGVYSEENRRFSRSKTNLACQEKRRRKQTVSDDKYDKRINKVDQPNFLPSIELKIENLIESINSFIHEIREEKIKEKGATSNASDINSMNNLTKENAIKQLKIDTINVTKSFSNKKCEITTQTDSNAVELSKTLKDKNMYSKKNKEHITKSNQSKINIQENCYFISTFSTSLKERATEITNSFVETQVQVSKTINVETNSPRPELCMVEKITKEANTEPLGILALLRISAQTAKQLLSCLPTIDYYSYIPHFQFRCPKASEEPNYICNICGAAFYKATMLNEHIKGHDLGPARDCAVCQHVLKSHKLHSQELFKCQFCGQRFTRAYCCELHQQSCARLLGLKHDASNLILLQ